MKLSTILTKTPFERATHFQDIYDHRYYYLAMIYEHLNQVEEEWQKRIAWYRWDKLKNHWQLEDSSFSSRLVKSIEK